VSKKVFNMQGGKHSAAAYTELEKWAYGSCVASIASFVASAGTGMNLNISTGAGLISDTIARRIGTDALETAAVPAASASFNRIDTLVAYIDTAVTPTTGVTDNTNDILKFVVVAGTAASTPVAPTGAAIISAIGAGKPYMVLYDILLPQNAVNLSGITLTDRRVVMSPSAIPNNIVTTAKINNLAVTNAKINDVSAVKLYNPYKFSVRRVAGTSTSIGLQRMNWDTKTFDTSGNYDNTTNYRFIAPVAGYYQFNMAVSIAAVTPTRLFCIFYKNGLEIMRGTDIAAACQGAGVSGLVYLNASEYLEGWLYINLTGGTYHGTASYMDGHLVSTT
jgi:hypothetical protein